MTKAPKKPDSRAKALAGMNRAELIRTVKGLDKRVTKLLNEIAEKDRLSRPPMRGAPQPTLNEASYEQACEVVAAERQVSEPRATFPWEK